MVEDMGNLSKVILEGAEKMPTEAPAPEPDMNDPRYCGACKRVHRQGQVACDPLCSCDHVDCQDCGPRVAKRVLRGLEQPEWATRKYDPATGEFNQSVAAPQAEPEVARIAGVIADAIHKTDPLYRVAAPKAESAGKPEPWSDWAHKHMTALRNAIFATVPEEERVANIDDDKLVAWPAELERRSAKLRAELEQVQEERDKYQEWMNCGGCPNPHKCSDPSESGHEIFGCAYGQGDGTFLCEVHYLRATISRAEAAESSVTRLTREREEAREALRYLLMVRNIKCQHKHPGPDKTCANCRALAALVPTNAEKAGRGAEQPEGKV